MILLQLDPINLTGIELLISNTGHIQKNERKFDVDIYDELSVDEFQEASQLEFNLHLKGLVKSE